VAGEQEEEDQRAGWSPRKLKPEELRPGPSQRPKVNPGVERGVGELTRGDVIVKRLGSSNLIFVFRLIRERK